MSNTDSLLSIHDLRVDFPHLSQPLFAVYRVSLSIPQGKTVALVGESGCGKSITALSIMGLLPQNAQVVSGQILFEQQNLLELKEAEIRRIRGRKISMIFQEPMTSLNPVLTVGEQIVEVIRLHQKQSTRQARQTAIEMLDKVGITEPQLRINYYPHQMSGGMRQRVMIAMAISCQSSLLIADEPTTALDVTVQAQILELLKKLQVDSGMSILLITHDFGVVAEVADEVYVMRQGRIIEQAEVFSLFERPEHPYTKNLLNCLPRIGQSKPEPDGITQNSTGD